LLTEGKPRIGAVTPVALRLRPLLRNEGDEAADCPDWRREFSVQRQQVIIASDDQRCSRLVTQRTKVVVFRVAADFRRGSEGFRRLSANVINDRRKLRPDSTEK
jgi:hypothetical protein